MEEACREAEKGRGITVGILPSSDPNSNPHVDVPIPTGMEQLGWNGIVALASAVVVVGGRSGRNSVRSGPGLVGKETRYRYEECGRSKRGHRRKALRQPAQVPNFQRTVYMAPKQHRR
jgi:hypothetical protein